MDFRTQAQHVVDQHRAAKRGHATRLALLAKMASDEAMQGQADWLAAQAAKSAEEMQRVNAELDATWAELQRALYCRAKP